MDREMEVFFSIELQKHPVLFDKKDPNYRSQYRRRKALEKLAEASPRVVPASAIRNMILDLRKKHCRIFFDYPEVSDEDREFSVDFRFLDKHVPQEEPMTFDVTKGRNLISPFWRVTKQKNHLMKYGWW